MEFERESLILVRWDQRPWLKESPPTLRTAISNSECTNGSTVCAVCIAVVRRLWTCHSGMETDVSFQSNGIGPTSTWSCLRNDRAFKVVSRVFE